MHPQSACAPIRLPPRAGLWRPDIIQPTRDLMLAIPPLPAARRPHAAAHDGLSVGTIRSFIQGTGVGGSLPASFSKLTALQEL
jgi:hypothetical protein